MNWKESGRKQSHVIKVLAWYLARRTEECNANPHPWQPVSRPRFEPGSFPAHIVVTATPACLVTVCCWGWWEHKGEWWVDEDETRSKFWRSRYPVADGSSCSRKMVARFRIPGRSVHVSGSLRLLSSVQRC